MIRAMYSGVSGMAAHQTKLNVIGNNIANVNTYGFKSSRVVFSDVLYQNIKGAAAAGVGVGGANASQIGYGVKVASIDLNNTITGGSDTGRGLDVYINGEGFFPIKLTDGTIKYTRVGNLKFDTQGNLTDGAGNLVMGSNVQGDPNLEVNADIAQDTLNAANKALVEAKAASTEANEALTKAAKDDATAKAKVTAAQTALAQAEKALASAQSAVTTATDGIKAAAGKIGGTTGVAAALETAMKDSALANVKALETKATTVKTTANTLVTEEGKYATSLATDPATPIPADLAAARKAFKSASDALETSIGLLTADEKKEVATLYADLTTQQTALSKGQNDQAAGVTSVTPAKEKRDAADIALNGKVAAGGDPAIIGALEVYETGKTAEKKAQVQLAANTANAIQIDAANTVAIATEALSAAQISADGQRTPGPSLDGGLLDVNQLQSIRVDPATLNACTSISIGKSGDITGIKNGRPIVLGSLSVAKFVNPEGLNQDGDGYYQVSANSGPAEVTRPGTNATGGIESSQLEMSNVDLSKEFTEMIVAQRGFQANTRIVTVSDQILEELINLKR